MITQRTVITGFAMMSLLVAIPLLSCKTNTEMKQTEGDIQSEVLHIESPQLELTFGDKDLPDEYLLARPMQLYVDNNDNIYVFDETRIKVYDKDGGAKEIIGGPGQGPGEFSDRMGMVGSNIYVSPTGFISVSGDIRDTWFNVYDRQYKFLDRYHKNMYNPSGGYSTATPIKIIVLDEREYIGLNISGYRQENFGYASESLNYYKGDTVTEIAVYDKISSIYKGTSSGTVNFAGTFFWDIMPDRTIVYTHSRFDADITDEIGYYVIHFYNLDTGERSSIRHAFEPVPIVATKPPDIPGRRRSPLEERLGYDRMQLVYERRVIMAEKYIYHEPLWSLIVDGKTGYVFINQVPLNAENPLIDIFDLENQNYLRTVTLSLKRWYIKNGFVYTIGQSAEGFDVIEKYKINPAVYGK